MTPISTTATVPDLPDGQPPMPWGPVRGLAATLTLAGTVTVAVLAGHAAAPGGPVIDEHVTGFAVGFAVMLGVLAGWTVIRAWRRGGDADYALDVFDTLCFASSMGALFTHHSLVAFAVWAPRLAFAAVTWFPAQPITYLAHAWWTPVGAYRLGQAQAALDAAAHLHALVTDPRLDGADAEQLVAVFTRDARAVAADALGDARDLHLGQQVVCSICARSTADQPCPSHQPALHAAHNDDEGDVR